MNKSRVPISWASRFILNNSHHHHHHHHHHHPISFSSQFLARRDTFNQTRDFSGNPEVSKKAIFGNDNLDDAFKWTSKLNKFEEKKQFPTYTTGGQLAKYTAITASGNYNGVVGLAKAKGLAVPITFQKAYEKTFQVRMIHNLADKVKQLETPNAKSTGTWETRSSYSTKAEETSNHSNFLRPLSPHLPIYKPQRNSLISILNRVSAAYLVLGVVYFDLVYLKLGSVCLSFDSFYLYLFYSSKLTTIPLQMAALATVYHTAYGIKHLAAYRLR